MDKKAFLAILLSLVVLISWQTLFVKPQIIANKGVIAKETSTEIVKNVQPATVTPISRLATEDVLAARLENNKFRLDVLSLRGTLANGHFKDYNLNFEFKDLLGNKFSFDKPYTIEKNDGKVGIYNVQSGHSLYKSISYDKLNYVLDLEIVYKNTTNTAWLFNDSIVLNDIPQGAHPDASRLYEAFWKGQDTIHRKNPLSIKGRFTAALIDGYIGFRDRYSCLVLVPESSSEIQRYFSIERAGQGAVIAMDLENIKVPANSEITQKYKLYCGPQDINLLKQFNLGAEDVVYFGGFDFISQVLLSIMRFLHNVLHSWGLAIIFLSILVYICLYPLSFKQMQSMKHMQMLQPQIEALRKAYKDNPQRLNKEIMDLYKKNKVNPLGGCLPMLLQIPIFFGLYQALYRSVELKGAAFLWIKDLAEPDRLFVFSSGLPILGKELNILPILMAIGMFFQQRITMKSSTAVGTSAEQQKMMLWLFPILFGFIFYKFPSGLNLYWFINTLLTTFTQWKTLRTTNTVKGN
mgnify:FL=1